MEKWENVRSDSVGQYFTCFVFAFKFLLEDVTSLSISPLVEPSVHICY